ncbi:hypothetical protein LJB85_04110, partial [Porphyromonadaceae bacterium OttesenSCG-928-L07]|nr:hypothetical protein [Porphyromonadaceae bacterium OttesenSCG-928-L07]MDL2252158.1 hypothetical protein [Odoribacter sp. OttesenSCG-928-J03]
MKNDIYFGRKIHNDGDEKSRIQCFVVITSSALLLFLLIFLFSFNVCGQINEQHNIFIHPKLYIGDSIKIADVDRYHPSLHSSLKTAERDSFRLLLEQRKKLFSGDSITVTEHFVLWHPYIMRLNYEDPHYRVVPLLVIANKKYKENDLRVIPVNVLLINDTVIVSKSLDEKIKIGDRILSINDEPIEKYTEFYYKDRYAPLLM